MRPTINIKLCRKSIVEKVQFKGEARERRKKVPSKKLIKKNKILNITNREKTLFFVFLFQVKYREE